MTTRAERRRSERKAKKAAKFMSGSVAIAAGRKDNKLPPAMIGMIKDQDRRQKMWEDILKKARKEGLVLEEGQEDVLETVRKEKAEPEPEPA